MRRTHTSAVVMVVACFLGSASESFAAADNISGACAGTPAAALQAAQNATSTTAPALVDARGFRVTSIRWDSLQRRNWAVIESCNHQDRPSVIMAMGMAAPALSTASPAISNAPRPIVHAGDVVRLWKNDRLSHLEITGIAEENGATGAHVRVRLAASKDAEGQVTQPRYFAGIVRGPANVEMEP